jgi:hypothetical protein
MNYRYFEESDYELLKQWWKFWRFASPPLDMLPTTGVIVNKDGVDICAGFIYFTNSKTCWIEFIVSNPNVRVKEDRIEAITNLIDILCSVGKTNGYTIAYTSLKNKNLQDKYLKCGFLEGSKNCNEYIKQL